MTMADSAKIDSVSKANNVALWDSVSKTDPRFCKEFVRAGSGFRGTAINPLYSIFKATETWGPVGTGFGWSVLDEKYIEAAPIMHEGHVIGREIIHTMLISLWYKNPGSDEVHTVQHSGATMVVTQSQYGRISSDEEHRKKSLTDAISKALSVLGFSADIWLGTAGFETSKYVNQSGSDAKPAPTKPPHEMAMAALEAAKTKEDLDKARTRYTKSANLADPSISKDQFEALEKRLIERQAEIVLL